MVMEDNPLQSEKQKSPKLVTELGIVMEVKLEQSLKQLCPKFVTELGISVLLQPTIKVLVNVSIIALQFSLESYTVLPASTDIFSKPIHPKKHSPPKLVTELGMIMEFKPLQPLKQLCSNTVTELGMVIEVKPLQSAKQ